MTRPRVIDTFMVNDELDMLECRLYELAGVVDYFVAVEANVDHQDHPKPFHLSENLDRFADYRDKLIVVKAKGLPPRTFDPDPWAREHAQREHAFAGLERIGVEPDDVVLHGDIDEIPTTVVARNLRPTGAIVCGQRGHFWSLRWRYPIAWHGTVATRARNIKSFSFLRDTRNVVPVLPDAGWHLSWLPVGGKSSEQTARDKVGSFCHPEVEERILDGLDRERFVRDGVHVDGVKMVRCDIDGTFPRWIVEGKCPESWLA